MERHHVLVRGVDVPCIGALVADQALGRKCPANVRLPHADLHARLHLFGMSLAPSGGPCAVRHRHPAIAVQTREWIDLR
jgi:hypothetical protein